MYGEYTTYQPVSRDPLELFSGDHLALALRASPGSDKVKPVSVGYENVTSLYEDDFGLYQCQIRVSPANILALRATRFSWTYEAELLAMPVAPPMEAVEAVRRTMSELARQKVEALRRFRDLNIRLRARELESVEAEVLRTELHELLAVLML
jgi:hypothetical protein